MLSAMEKNITRCMDGILAGILKKDPDIYLYCWECQSLVILKMSSCETWTMISSSRNKTIGIRKNRHLNLKLNLASELFKDKFLTLIKILNEME